MDSLTGNDSLIINGRIITGFADANSVDVSPAADIGVAKKGKNNNTIYARNEMGRMANMVLRLVIGCDDDKYINSLLQQWKQSTSDFILMTGTFNKRVGDGKGNIQTKVHQLLGGFPKNFPKVTTAAEGDTNQSVSEWNITWGDCDISIQ